ncbi:hypothetical protein LTR85_003731 [Meristemomyces frigidus]|nr:hypothetical protein LTR85_003731 [Meristemomyces frigidus]
MKHIHGVEVTLHAANGSQITEHANTYAKGLAKYSGRVSSRLMSEKPGKPFRVCIAIGENFKIYKAEGVKIVIVVVRQDAASRKVVRRSQAWWLEVNGKKPAAEYVLDCFTNGEDIKAVNQRVAFAMPQPADDFATATAEWVVQEFYTANEGCISVFVERGVLDLTKMKEEFSPLDTRQVLRHKPGSPLPICLHWFYPLRSENSNPYVFEFRNISMFLQRAGGPETPEVGRGADSGAGKDAIDARHLDASSEVGYVTDDLFASKDDSMASSTSSGSSEEATAAESDADSSSESDMVVTSKKRRAKAAQPTRGRKQRRTNNMSAKALPKPLKWGPLSAEQPVDWKQRACHDQDDDEPLPVRPKPEIKSEDKARKTKAKKVGRKGNLEGAPVAEETYTMTRKEEVYSVRAEKTPVVGKPGMRSATAAPSKRHSEDEQALNDELRAIEIRQKLRKMKKLRRRDGEVAKA